MTTEYPAAIADLLAIDHPTALDAGTPHRGAMERLNSTPLKDLFAPMEVRDTQAALACVAGLWLRFDWLDKSHELSQSIATPDGSFWHGKCSFAGLGRQFWADLRPTAPFDAPLRTPNDCVHLPGRLQRT